MFSPAPGGAGKFARKGHQVRILLLRKELDARLEKAELDLEWADVKQDLTALHDITIDENGKRLTIRSECLGCCGKVFKAVGVAIPPAIRENV